MAGALVGGAFLSASLQVLFDRLASPDVLAFLRGKKRSDNLLSKLKIKLLAVEAVLDDAEEKQITNPHVKRWMEELKHAVYDAEDLLDEVATEALRRNMEPDSPTVTTQVRTFISAGLYPFSQRIKSRVETIAENLELLAREKDVLGLRGGSHQKLSRRWPATCLVDESGVCGRRDDKEKIVEFLMSEHQGGNKVGVISLVGMGGIGKTTLAQLVYNDSRLDGCFDLKAWVCVSDEFDLVRITRGIVESIRCGTTSNDDDLNQLHIKLKKELSSKKFLLVLDDVWNENYSDWDKLQIPFTVGLNGSKIVVTTRSDKVASIVRSVHTHRLEQLSLEDSWSLFARHAFENGDSSPHPKLEEIGKKIIKKCKGLPLAAKTLGGALYSEFRVEEWERLLNNETWDLPNDEVLPALRLSYSFLPSPLKRCFAYCSIFPKDYEFEKEDLILLWMAEGFLQQSEGNRTMEKVGDEYFDDLLSRSFFQKSRSRKSYFVMHDLIHDLAQHVYGIFCIHLKDDRMNEIPVKVRHLSYFGRETKSFRRLGPPTNFNGLRTFLSLPNHLPFGKSDKVSKTRGPHTYGYVPSWRGRVPNTLLQKAQYLRVLSLCFDGITDLPETIGNLKHLRYIDLSCTPIKRLPDSVCNLYNLQTLILLFCQSLVELPTGMHKLISLRHLDIRHCKMQKMPSQMGELKSLQRLSRYIVGKKSGTRVGELRELSQLGGELKIEALQNVVDGRDALEANLVGKQYLDHLWLMWNDGIDIDQNGAKIVLPSLQPHSNLKRLTIEGYCGLRFPDWLTEGCPTILINIVSLRLWRCKNVSTLPPLGQLPSLKHLYISGLVAIESVSAEFYGTQPCFQSLKALSFVDMPKWKEWLCLEGQGGGELFPRLKELYIEACPLLTGDLPVYLPLLTKLTIERCEQLVAPLPRVPAIRELTTRSCTMSRWEELPPLLHSLEIQDFSYGYLSSLLEIQNSESLEYLLEEGILQSSNITCLQNLRIIFCAFSRTLCKVCLPSTLKSLELHGSKNIEFLLPELLKCHFPLLERFSIAGSLCNSLSTFTINIFPRLTHLSIQCLEALKVISFEISERDPTSNFQGLDIQGCDNLLSIELPALTFSWCYISYCKNLKSARFNAACFQSLDISCCPELEFPEEGLPSSLTSLSIVKCDEFTSQMESALRGLPSLRHFMIKECKCEWLKVFPEEDLLPPTLTSLEISCLPYLESLDSKGLQMLASLKNLVVSDCPNLRSVTEERLPTSLQNLEVRDCPNLRSLTKERLPSSLSSLTISRCPLLKQYWYKSRKGEDWRSIAHIPHIVIDGQLL